MTKTDILDSAKSEQVEFIDFQFSDMHGALKALTIPVSKLADALEHNVWFDGSSIEGFTRIFESDMFLKPDLDTWAIIPWTRGTKNVSARFICDVYTPDGKPFEGDPRFILRKEIERAIKLGFTYYVGPELEFFLLKKEDFSKNYQAHDHAGYFDQETDLGTEIRGEMTHALRAFGIDVEALHHEVAPGQHEIDFKYGDALKTADNAITLKYTIKSIANRHGLLATFMAKPIFGVNGSGMHVHQSLFKGSENVFYDPNGTYGLSKLATQYLAGLMKHIKALNAIINPTVNSYKRLVVGYEAPVYIAWGQKNRSALIRIPHVTKGNEKGTRVELRCPDPTANPYLAFAVMLRAGLDGIEHQYEPPAPIEDNIWDLGDEGNGIEHVAANLKEALEALADNHVIRDVLGEHTFARYIEGKMSEYDESRIRVSEWEKEKYLGY